MISFARSLGTLYGSFVGAAGVLFLAMSIHLIVTTYPDLSGTALLVCAVGISVGLVCIEYARRLITGRRRYRVLSPFMLRFFAVILVGRALLILLNLATTLPHTGSVGFSLFQALVLMPALAAGLWWLANARAAQIEAPQQNPSPARSHLGTYKNLLTEIRDHLLALQEGQWSKTLTTWICELDVKPSRDSLCTHLARSMQSASRLADVEICSENGHVLAPGFTSFREAKTRLLQLSKRLSSVCEEIAGKLACPVIGASANVASGIDSAPVRSAPI